MLRYAEIDVRQLLQDRFAELESLWEASPYDEALAYAITIKDFMRDHGIVDLADGIERFWQLKQSQNATLVQLGLASRLTGPLASRLTGPLPSPGLASQAAY